LETRTYQERIKILVMDLEDTEARNICAGEGQKQFKPPTEFEDGWSMSQMRDSGQPGRFSARYSEL
jgi:hypothetical protein